ncbi:kynureninase [Alkalicoccus chagannorensis]|uniref:kynureninase n=1 Tax=Alkalicoccus chagannorensis TaxID=427072 RepID=UPI0003FA04D9|nr:kynureninase [Alkalicoccus chagannorensis]
MLNEWKKEASAADERDPLAAYQREFYFPEHVRVYLDGNSLGLLSHRAEAAVQQALEEWKTKAIGGWGDASPPWFHQAEQLGASAAALVGSLPHETIIAGSITSNLHQLLHTFYRPGAKRRKIVMEAGAFPTDHYAVTSLLRSCNQEDALVLVYPDEHHILHEEDIEAAVTDETALVLLPSVLYRTGQRLNMKQLTKHASDAGAVIGWDLAHSFGVMPHELHELEADFAVWCTYKYANSGPGGTAGLFVHEKHHHLTPALAGWFGSDKDVQFDMEETFTPAAGAGAFQQGTPPILSTAPLLGSLEMLLEAGIERIRAKSLQLTTLLRRGITLLPEEETKDLRIITPAEGTGGHLAVTHPYAAGICEALKKEGIIPDYREPNIIRLAPSPLTTSAADIVFTVETLHDILKKETYLQYKNERGSIA